MYTKSQDENSVDAPPLGVDMDPETAPPVAPPPLPESASESASAPAMAPPSGDAVAIATERSMPLPPSRVPMFRTLAPVAVQDISEPYSNEMDAQYMSYMSAMRGGITARKAAVEDRIKRMQEAEQHSETARVLKILNTPMPDREPTPMSNTKFPSWMRATEAPALPPKPEVKPLPPAQDIYGRNATVHRKQMMTNMVGSYGRAGTSTYRNWALPEEQEWTGYGSGQGSIAPKWDRQGFMLERGDGDIQPAMPPQAVTSSLQPSFRQQENTSLGVSRSFNLHVNTTGAPGMYSVQAGIAAPSVAPPQKDTTLGVGPQASGLSVLPAGGNRAPQASIRLKLGTIMSDPTSLPPTQVAAFNVGAMESDVRLADDSSVPIVPAADNGGRADYPSAPATEMSADPDRYVDRDARDARASLNVTMTNTVSGTTSAAATPAVQSGHGDLVYADQEHLEARTAMLMRDMDVVSGNFAAPAMPATENDRSEAEILQQEAIRLRSAILQMIPQTHWGRAQARQSADELMSLQNRLGDVLSRMAVVSGMNNVPAPASQIDHMRDDTGAYPEMPDGRGASTNSKLGAYQGTPTTLQDSQGFSFAESAPHAATVTRYASAQNENRAAELTRLGARGPALGVRQVDHIVHEGGVRRNMGSAAMATAAAGAPVSGEIGDVHRRNVQTGTSGYGLSTAREKLGSVVLNSDMNFKESVQPDRDVSLVAPQRGASPPEVVYAPLRASKELNVNMLGSRRASLAPMGTSTPTVRDVLLVLKRDAIVF
ncbi:hypothetical protein JKP88DRAFT_272576 [Tribonema minus]|uniref:Uncharacterized protein n=1 Tax=Tribonema minus TaxID=303371 RepID=A0A836CHM0_9STRA|nr:hypothetical protein JKP88DRAFT_272576 [Tribonema minus]